MVFEYMKNNNMTNFGCVIILDDEIHLFTLNDNQDLLPSVIIEGDEHYSSLDDNEMLIVSLNVEYNNINISLDDINEDNVYDINYNLNPLSIYKLNTIGLIFNDILDFGILPQLFIDKLDDYLQTKVN